MKKHFLILLSLIMVVTFSVISCSSDNDEIGNSALVGTWTKQYDRIGVIGIRLTSDGKAYYSEWNAGEEPDFSHVAYPANAKVTATTIRITHSKQPNYFEEYNYVLSEDGKHVTFTLIDWEEDNHNLNGTFTKVQ